MIIETEEQVREATGSIVDLAVAPVGVGSFAQSVVSYWKSRPYPCTVSSLIYGVSTTVTTHNTIMSGLNCGTVTSIAWPILQKGVDVSVSISDIEADRAVK